MNIAVNGTMDMPVETLEYQNTNSGINPDPILLEDTEIIVSDFISPMRLQEITGRDDLENVTIVEMIVNTTETTMGNFGFYLPSLKHLKLSNSVIPSVRDIGTSLSHLNVLWMSCCGLTDADGIASMISLSELYIAYNDIKDISPLSFLENLQVLDMEGNQISDKEQFDYLSMLTKLKTLSVSGNPVCQILNKEAMENLQQNSFQINTDTMSYREVIIKKLPQLKYLDDEKCESFAGAHSMSSSDRPSTASLAASSHSQEDIDLINTAIKEGLITEEDTNNLAANENQFADTRIRNRPGSAQLRRPTSALNRPMTAGPLGRSLRSPLSRPQTAITGGRSSSANATKTDSIFQKATNAQRPSSSGSGDVNLQDESSTLTFGEVICGNPIKALRARKVSPLPVLTMLSKDDRPSQVMNKRPATAVPLRTKTTASAAEEQQKFYEREELYEELREWRIKNEQRMSDITSNVQVMKIHDNTNSSDDILLNSDATDSDADEMLDLDEIPDLQDDNNNFDDHLKVGQDKGLPNGRAQVRSPPPKNLSPSSMTSSQSSRSSPRSPMYSSMQFDATTAPVMKASPTPRSPVSPHYGDQLRHMPAPPKVGAPRPRTASDFRLRRSLGSSHDPFVPLASPMTLPQSMSPGKRQKSGPVNQ